METSSWPNWGYRPHNISPMLGPFLAGEVQGRSAVLLGTSHQGWAWAAKMSQWAPVRQEKGTVQGPRADSGPGLSWPPAPGFYRETLSPVLLVLAVRFSNLPGLCFLDKIPLHGQLWCACSLQSQRWRLRANTVRSRLMLAPFSLPPAPCCWFRGTAPDPTLALVDSVPAQRWKSVWKPHSSTQRPSQAAGNSYQKWNCTSCLFICAHTHVFNS